jgi:hypothetical protein
VLILGSWLPTQKQQLATELVSSVMVELGYTQAVDVTLVANSKDNRKGHYGEDNNIYLNDANLNNTKDLATTLGHEVLISLSFCWCIA